jgi:hypothetical protein
MSILDATAVGCRTDAAGPGLLLLVIAGTGVPAATFAEGFAVCRGGEPPGWSGALLTAAR